MSAATTVAPSSRSRSAVAWPMPDAAPVTRIRLLSSRFICPSSQAAARLRPQIAKGGCHGDRIHRPGEHGPRPLVPLFDATGQPTFAVSDEPHAANLVKLSGNFPDRVGHRIRRGGGRAGRKGRRRSAAVRRHPHLDAVRRSGVSDLWRADRATEIRAGRVRGDPRSQGHPAGARGSRRPSSSAARRQPVARPLTDPGGDRRTANWIGRRSLSLADRDAGNAALAASDHSA